MVIRRTAWAMCSALAAGWACGCAGGAPLLHGVHPLADGQVRAGAGMSATVANGSLRAAFAGSGAATGDVAARTRGAAATGAVAPGVAPWVSARAGLGGGNEVGLSYTGRAVRLDARHAFERGSLGVSVGAAASTLLDDRDDAGNLAHWALQRSSVGFDVPILVGWRSSAEIVTVYGGPRLGFERLAGDLTLSTDPQGPSSEVSVRHDYVGGLLGLTLGFRHLHGALELQTTYHRVQGHVGHVDVRTSGVTLTPAAGLVVTF